MAISAIEYITALGRSSCRRRSGLARPDQSAGHTKLKSQQPWFCLIGAKNKHNVFSFVRVALGAVAMVNQVIYNLYCLSISTMYPWHYCLGVIRSGMSPCWNRC